jgi:non-heme chloroperoxidase
LSKAALISAVPPLLLKTAADPGGLPNEVFDGIRHNSAADCIQFYEDIASGPSFGSDRTDAEVPQGMHDTPRPQEETQAEYRHACIKAFSETDFSEDLKKFDVPTLIIHGGNDRIVPIETAILRPSKLVGDTTLKVYPSAPHGLAYTHMAQLNADLLAFLRS